MENKVVSEPCDLHLNFSLGVASVWSWLKCQQWVRHAFTAQQDSDQPDGRSEVAWGIWKCRPTNCIGFEINSCVPCSDLVLHGWWLTLASSHFETLLNMWAGPSVGAEVKVTWLICTLFCLGLIVWVSFITEISLIQHKQVLFVWS